MDPTRETPSAEAAENEVMEKEAIVKEDGRSLTYYRFRPTSKAPSAEETR